MNPNKTPGVKAACQTLDKLEPGQVARVKRIKPGYIGAKLVDMGLYPGKQVRFLFAAPLGDPIALDLEGYILSLRKKEAAQVELELE